MENFIVSARKYRPQTFKTVVGQSHITNTLKNAIKNKQLAQAFLFCGPRGVGKTTCARILAKTINCFNVTSDIEPCNECESCKSFNSGASLNIYELDAASNNSVDDIRNLIDQVRFAPQLGSFKVYIIDEVHMLSAQAFNAFLKTLEEPPKHAIFILATTEKHKILPTILSRCQIFDFNRIKVEDIAEHLQYIAKTEGIASEAEALHVIAQKADGGLRDACSMFDQMVSFSGNNLTYKAVIANLHVLDYDYFFQITDHLYNQRLPEALIIFDEILKKGFDGHNFIVGLAEHFRNLLVCKDTITLQLLEVGESVKERYKEQAALCQNNFLMKGLALLNRTDTGYKAAKNQRLHVEVALMQLAYLNAASLDAEKKNDEPVAQQQSVGTGTAADKPKQQTVSFTDSNEKLQKVTSTPVTLLKDLNLQSGFRLSDVTRKQEVIAPVQETVSIPQINEPVTMEKLQLVIGAYAKSHQEKGGRQIFTILTAKPVILEEDTKVVIEVENEVMMESFLPVRQEFLDYLRKELSNNQISLDLRETQFTEQKKAYTPLEKFEALKNKNPLLLELKKKFDMEIDY